MSNLLKRKLPMSVVLAVVIVVLAGATAVEGTALNKPTDEHVAKKVSCVKCHTDKKTLAAIAEKSGDPLYLVHTGDLTAAQLKDCLRDKSAPAKAKSY